MRTPHALHNVFGPTGERRHNGVLVAPQCTQLRSTLSFAAERRRGRGAVGGFAAPAAAARGTGSVDGGTRVMGTELGMLRRVLLVGAEKLGEKREGGGGTDAMGVGGSGGWKRKHAMFTSYQCIAKGGRIHRGNDHSMRVRQVFDLVEQLGHATLPVAHPARVQFSRRGPRPHCVTLHRVRIAPR